MTDMYGDAAVACADLIGRCGASGFEIGYLRDGVPVGEAGWYATASFKDARIMTDEHRSPTGAAMALAERLLSGGTCRCGQPVSLSDAPPVHVNGERGDMAAMNRAMRRAARRRK